MLVSGYHRTEVTLRLWAQLLLVVSNEKDSRHFRAKHLAQLISCGGSVLVKIVKDRVKIVGNKREIRWIANKGYKILRLGNLEGSQQMSVTSLCSCPGARFMIIRTRSTMLSSGALGPISYMSATVILCLLSSGVAFSMKSSGLFAASASLSRIGLTAAKSFLLPASFIRKRPRPVLTATSTFSRFRIGSNVAILISVYLPCCRSALHAIQAQSRQVQRKRRRASYRPLASPGG